MLGDGVCDAECSSASCNFDGGDCVTSDNPVQVYVYPGGLGRAIGSESEPLPSIQTAMEQLWAEFTVIHLMNGTHILDNAGPQSTLTVPNNVKLIAVLCSDTLQLFCNPASATIQLTPNSVSFNITGAFTLQNIQILGNFPLLPDCISPECYYCPSTRQINGSTVTDKGEVVVSYAEQGVCEKYRDSVLMNVGKQAQLALNSVSFVDIRHQLLAIIYSECAELVLSNVTFSKVIPYRNGTNSAVITMKSTGSQCGSLNYTDGFIELLNDGYEYYNNTGNPFSGFIHMEGIKSMELGKLQFRLNNVLGTWTEPTNLVYVDMTAYVGIYGCVFQSTLSNGPTVVLINSSVLTVSDSVFEYNTASDIVKIAAYPTISVTFSNSTFRNNLAQDSIIGILGDKLSLPTITLTHVHFLRNQAVNTLSLNSSSILYISNTDFNYSGEVEGLVESVLEGYVGDSRTYMQGKPGVERPICVGTVFVKDAGEFSVEFVRFSDCNCSYGSPGLTYNGSFHTVISI